MGFDLVSALPDLNPPEMFELLVRVPRDFVHDVQRAAQVEMLSDPGLPLANVPFMNVTHHPMQVHLYLNTNGSSLLLPGKYRWGFPVLVPARMPKFNVFLLTICKPNPPDSSAP